MSDLRSETIRLASTMPRGSSERKALLEVLATALVSERVAALLPHDYTSLVIGVKTGKTSLSSDMDLWDNNTVRIPSAVTASDVESVMLRLGKRYPDQPVKMYGSGSGILDALLVWDPTRGFEVPDYGWEASNLRRPTRSDVARWINGRGPNPALQRLNP